MKAFQWKRFCAVLAALMLGVFCSACSQPPEPVTGSELEALRAEYPYAKTNEALSMAHVKDIAAFNNNELAAFVSVTITGPYTSTSTTESPAEGMPAMTTSTYFVPAHVDSVLYQSHFGGQTEIVLRIRGAMDGDNLDCYREGSKIVTMLTVPAAGLNASENEYFSGTESSFYLTDNNVLVSMSDQHPAFHQYSGWNADAFRQELKKALS